MKPFTIPRHRLNTPLALIVLSVTGVLGGCSHESQIPPQPPRAVRLATVAAPQTSAETLRYSASILPYAQVDLMFRSSGYVTNVRQVRGADGRTGYDYDADHDSISFCLCFSVVRFIRERLRSAAGGAR